MRLSKEQILQMAKGFYGRAKNCIRIARPRVERALAFQYEHRRLRKRDARRLWIQRINAGVQNCGLTYNQFIDGLKKDNIWLDRKMLSELASNEPESFKAIANHVKQSRMSA